MTAQRTKPVYAATLLSILGLTLMLAGLVGCGESAPPPSSSAQEVASPILQINGIDVTILGKQEGPYYLKKCLTPSKIELVDMNVKAEQFVLAGIRDDAYVLPAKALKPQETPVSEEKPEVVDKRRTELWKYKMDKFQELCGSKQLWLVRMSDQPPFQIYLFMPVNSQADLKNPTGPASLLNAQALQDGIASMELEDVHHPFYDIMLDCQLVSVLKAHRKSGTPPESVWSRFALQLPPGAWDERLAELEKRM